MLSSVFLIFSSLCPLWVVTLEPLHCFAAQESRLPNNRLGVGFIGSGFNARFHMLGWKGVRDADVLGVWSPNAKHAASAARYANDLDVGAARPFKSIADMVADPAIDAIWL